MGAVLTDRVMTAAPPRNSIGSVPSTTAVNLLLTKRRAVDFCRVATAMCPRFGPFAA